MNRVHPSTFTERWYLFLVQRYIDGCQSPQDPPLGVFYVQHNHTTWPLLIFCIMKIHRLGPGSNPQPWVQKASDKPASPPSRRLVLGMSSIISVHFENEWEAKFLHT
ncbi:hypothetical protein TNCV_4933541 [Trichonephila clavipes]|nr:hypothetical protein TNCV_4933541 [Trichonephila clavipes]